MKLLISKIDERGYWKELSGKQMGPDFIKKFVNKDGSKSVSLSYIQKDGKEQVRMTVTSDGKDISHDFENARQARKILSSILDQVEKTMTQVDERIILNELYDNWEYNGPDDGDKEKKLYDFYVLTFLPPSSDEGLEMAREAAIEKVVDSTANDFLLAVPFAICAEFRHIFDRNESDDLKEWFQEKGKLEFLKKYALTYQALKSTDTSVWIDVDKIRRSLADNDQGYKNSYRAVKSTGISWKEFAEIAQDAFVELEWAGSFGGQPWSNIAKGFLSLYNASNIKDKMVYVDHIYDLQHNTGSVFTKVRTYYKEGYSWLKKALDKKAKVSSVYELFGDCSSYVKTFAAAALKNPASGEGTTFEAWAKSKGVFKTKVSTEKSPEDSTSSGFQVGDKVMILKKMEHMGKDGKINWVGSMDDSIGKQGEITALYRTNSAASVRVDFFEYQQIWTFDLSVLKKVEDSGDKILPPEDAKENQLKFKKGDNVKIVKKIPYFGPGKNIGWIDEMDVTLGKEGIIVEVFKQKYYRVVEAGKGNGYLYAEESLEFADSSKEVSEEFKVGDEVKIIKKKFKIGKSLVDEGDYVAEWVLEMDDTIGMKGEIIWVFEGQEYAKVQLKNGQKWNYDFESLEKVGKEKSKLDEIEIGDTVEIIDAGKYYPNYKTMAKKLKATNWVRDYAGVEADKKDLNGLKATVSNVDKDDLIYLITLENGVQILIEKSGIKKVDK